MGWPTVTFELLEHGGNGRFCCLDTVQERFSVDGNEVVRVLSVISGFAESLKDRGEVFRDEPGGKGDSVMGMVLAGRTDGASSAVGDEPSLRRQLDGIMGVDDPPAQAVVTGGVREFPSGVLKRFGCLTADSSGVVRSGPNLVGRHDAVSLQTGEWVDGPRHSAAAFTGTPVWRISVRKSVSTPGGYTRILIVMSVASWLLPIAR